MSKDLKIVIAIALMIVVLLSSFIYNRPSFLASRTLPYDLPKEAEIVESRRFGVLYWTKGYQMKIKISHENPEEYLDILMSAYDQPGHFMSYEEYQEFATSIFQERDIIPVVEENTNVYVSVFEMESGESVTHIIASADQFDAYMYVYWYNS